MICPPTAPAVIHQADIVYPEISKVRGAAGTAIVQLDLSETGKPMSVTIVVSSANAAFDAEALRVARNTTYQPATAVCRNIPAEYAIEVKFKAQAARDIAQR